MAHNLFYTHDLVRIIAECLGVDNPTPKRDFLAFLLTCRTFSEPGINMLWRSLDDTSPLAYLFHPRVAVIQTIHTYPRGTSRLHWDEWNAEEQRIGKLV